MKIVRAKSRTGLTLSLQPDGTYARVQGAVKTFDAGISSRLTSDWTAISRLSADGELQGKLPVMRSRSREGEQNDAFQESYLKLRENNVVGHDGFTLQMKVKQSETIDPATGEVEIVLDHVANRSIERAWLLFSQRKNFLVTRDMHATEACKLIERTWQRDGELLVRKVRGAPNEFGFALQLLEVDYLDDQFIDFRGVPCNCPVERTLPDGRPFPRCQTGTHEVRMGVELHGDWKFPVAYWLLARHPGDYFWGNQYATQRIRVPVEDIIHSFTHKRIEQTRGIPAAHAALLRFHMIGGMDEATLVASRAGAQKMGVITKEVPDELAADFDPKALEGRTIDGSPGEFLELPMGFDIKSIDWKNPDEAYGPFQKVQLRGCAAALGVSYHSLTGDLESVNFSSGRLGHIEQREGFRGGQSAFIHDILLEAFPDFLQAAMLRGIVDLPFDRFDAYTDPEAVVFHGRGFEFYDPTKDIEYAERAIALGIATRADFAAETSKDFEQVTAELSREKQIRESAGLGEPTPKEPAKTPVAPLKSQISHLKSTKSAHLGDVCLSDLPEHVQALIGEFTPGASPDDKVTRYQMTVPELLDKADQRNLATAQRRVAKRTIASSAAEVLERKDKHILLLNDRIIDGHHHLAKAEKGKITSSLPVLDLTPLRFQSLNPQPSTLNSTKGWVTINGAHVFIEDDASQAASESVRDFENTLMHGVDFQPSRDLAGWHAMEKFDGHRVHWDGKNLRTRKGKILEAPEHFTASLGKVPFDAELYAGKGQRDKVTRALAKGGDWSGLQLQAFDLPGHPGDFPARHAALAQLPLPAHVQRPGFTTMASTDAATHHMREVAASGGEGLILHEPGRKYAKGRINGLVKLKPGMVESEY